MVSVERVRPGLFCAYISQWRPNDLTAKDDSIANEKPAMVFKTATITYKKPTPVFGFKFGDKPEDKPIAATATANSTLGSQTKPAVAYVLFHNVFGAAATTTTANSTFGSSQTQSSLFGVSNPPFSFGTMPTFGMPTTAFAAPSRPVEQALPPTPNSEPLNNIGSGSKTTQNELEVEQKLVEYAVEFVLDKNSYILKMSFTKSILGIVGSLVLEILEPKMNTAAVATKEQDEVSSNEEKADYSLLHYDHKKPCAIWANFIGNDTKIHILKKSWTSDFWMSGQFDGSFACPVVPMFGPVTASQGVWKPITCLLWIEFETITGGEKNTLKQLTELYVRQNRCDVQFNLEGNQQIGGHTYILATRSSVFAAMFQHDMQESKTGIADIQDVKADIFKQMLYYIYSGQILTPLTEESAQPLFAAADKYAIEDLRKECVVFLLSSVRIDNAINLMVWAHLHSVDKLKKVCLTFAAQHGKDICLLKDWEELTKNYPDLCVVATRKIVKRLTCNLNFK